MPNDTFLSVLDPLRSENWRRNSDNRRSYTWSGPRRRQVPYVEFSLGWELEANVEATRYPLGVEKNIDGSVNGDSAEYVVMPSITKRPQYVLGLLKELVHDPELHTDESCGFHVHIAPKISSEVKKRQWAIVCQELAQRVEEAAFRAVPQARRENNYCRRVQLLTHGTRFASNKYSNDQRYQWLNVVEMFRPGGIRTVEVRLLGNTHRWKYLLAWVTFCLELGKQAWKVQHGGLTMDQAAHNLGAFLNKIAEEVRPLEKRNEPLPQWVYDALHKLGIDSSAWDRPLQKLYAAECEVTGRRKVFYSDAQLHDDGDCDADYCDNCHSNGDCDSRYCQSCRESAHNNGDLCEWTDCRDCQRERRRQLELPVNGSAPATANVETSGVLNGVRVERVVIDESVNVSSSVPAGPYVTIAHPSNVSEIGG